MDNLIFGLSTTAVGMLVVFLGLVILIACISIMGLLNKQSGAGKKAASAPKATTPPPAPVQPETVAAPVQPESDDQLIAVITAAIAAVWQGNQSGFVVRRVKRINTAPAWQKGAREEQMYGRM